MVDFEKRIAKWNASIEYKVIGEMNQHIQKKSDGGSCKRKRTRVKMDVRGWY